MEDSRGKCVCFLWDVQKRNVVEITAQKPLHGVSWPSSSTQYWYRRVTEMLALYSASKNVPAGGNIPANHQ